MFFFSKQSLRKVIFADWCKRIMTDNMFQLLKNNKWNFGIPREGKEEILSLHLDKRKYWREYFEKCPFPIFMLIHEILSKRYDSLSVMEEIQFSQIISMIQFTSLNNGQVFKMIFNLHTRLKIYKRNESW